MTLASNDRNALIGDAHNLAALINVITDQAIEFDRFTFDLTKSGVAQFDAMGGLLWIARDLVNQLAANAEACYGDAAAASMQDLIDAAKAAQAEFNRVFAEVDQGRLPADAEQTSLTVADEAMLAVCLARPQSDAEAALRMDYLMSDLPRRTDSCPGLIKAVYEALIKSSAPTAEEGGREQWER